MQGSFVDVYMPAAIPGYPCLSSPRFSTTITSVSDGDEGRNQNWLHPLRHFKLPAATAREWAVVDDLVKMSLCLGGPFNAFAWRDPFDFASVDLLAPNEDPDAVLDRVTPSDQLFGTGDGFTRVFQLTKTYVYSGLSYTRPIALPILADLVIAIAGEVSEAFSVTRPGGQVTFTDAPANGAALTWGGLFDVPVRFDSDEGLDGVVQAWRVGGAAEINLDEMRSC